LQERNGRGTDTLKGWTPNSAWQAREALSENESFVSFHGTDTLKGVDTEQRLARSRGAFGK
jgi:hypothetical protein